MKSELNLKWFKCRKKPVVVEAALLDKEVKVKTLEGTMLGKKGDYLIEGINGELYPCKPDIFKKTYQVIQ